MILLCSFNVFFIAVLKYFHYNFDTFLEQLNLVFTHNEDCLIRVTHSIYRIHIVTLKHMCFSGYVNV